MERRPLDELGGEATTKLSPLPNVSESTRRMSGSMPSSLELVRAVKSASITLANVSMAPRSTEAGQENRESRTGVAAFLMREYQWRVMQDLLVLSLMRGLGYDQSNVERFLKN